VVRNHNGFPHSLAKDECGQGFLQVPDAKSANPKGVYGLPSHGKRHSDEGGTERRPLESGVDMLTRIFSRSKDAGMSYAIDCEDYSLHLVWFPEIKFRHAGASPTPLHPAEQIELCPQMVGKTIITLSEYIILWFLREIGEGRMQPEDVELYCDGERIRIDVEGELIDKWPGEFFRERANLLFY
jgi:hypothetical protein